MNSIAITAPPMSAADSFTLAPFTLPDVTQLVEQTLADCLHRSHPGVVFEYASTFLVCHKRSAKPGAPRIIRSYPVLASVTECFTGRFQWEDIEIAGLYRSDMPPAGTPPIGELDRHALVALYAFIKEQLPKQYKKMLVECWTQIQPSGKTRRDDIIAERVEMLKLEAQMRVELGQFSTQLCRMLNDTLDYSMDTTAAPTQKHEVFNLSLGTAAGPVYPVTGAFVIIEQRSDQTPASDDESLGEAILYTPADSLERFNSLKELTETLNRRLADAGQRHRLLSHLKRLDVAGLAFPEVDEAPAVHWRLLNMTRSFMSLLLTSQIIKQYADFDHAMATAQSLRMDQDSFSRLLSDLQDSDQLFDNHRIARQLDCDAVCEQMPDEWQKMTERQRAEWARYATSYGQAIRSIRGLTQEHFETPLSATVPVIAAYIDATVSSALKEQAVELAPQQIQVQATYHRSVLSNFYPLVPLKTATYSQSHPLIQWARDNLLRTNIEHASEVVVLDERHRLIAGLSGDWVKALLVRIGSPEHLDRYLADHFDHGEYAVQLKHQHRQLLLSRMRMAYIESQQTGFPENRVGWIKAVMDGLDARNRDALDSATLEVRQLHISGMKIPDVMLIAPVDMFERGPLVLCTPSAPDNVVFRTFDSMFHLVRAFLESETHKSYVATLLPSGSSGLGRVMLEYNEWLKHWSLPEFMTSLRGPPPVPAHIFKPVAFMAQSRDLIDELFENKICQLKDDVKSRLLQPSDAGESIQTLDLDLVVSVSLILLPDPVMIPLALGLGLAKAWSAFHKVDDNDWDGAAQELINAAGYLLAAGVGHAGAAAVKAPQLALTRRPHLVRRTGRNGQTQIGYLLSPAGTPYFVESGMLIRMDPDRFIEISVGSDQAYVARRFNLFGHSRLYRRYARDAGLLIHEDEYVVRSSTGIWSKASQPIVRLSRQTDRQARQELALLLKGWPTAAQGASFAEASLDEPRFLALAQGAKAELYPEMLDYIEGGSASINRLLRSGARTPETQQFLEQFYRLRRWKGDAFRAARVTDEGLLRLRSELGAVFADAGVQSASISRANAARWSLDGFVTEQAPPGSHPVFFIFAPTVPKQNMFSNFLPDHVAIPPGTRLQLSAFREVGGQAFAYFTAPDRIPYETFDLFNGERELFVR
jgi:hypothetical protein